jgi:CelD/BcsL family acetyltransferase involved in cellulose biosynthesis
VSLTSDADSLLSGYEPIAGVAERTGAVAQLFVNRVFAEQRAFPFLIVAAGARAGVGVVLGRLRRQFARQIEHFLGSRLEGCCDRQNRYDASAHRRGLRARFVRGTSARSWRARTRIAAKREQAMDQVVEINALEELLERRADWDRLLEQSPRVDFFHTLDWLEVYWKHFGGRQRLRVLLIHKAGELTGILPLVVRPDRTKVGTFCVLTYPLDDWGSFYGPIGPRPVETLRAGLAHIRETRRDWNYLELRWVDSAPLERDGVADALRTANLAGIPRPHVSMPLIDITEGWDVYWASRSGSWRGNYRRLGKKVEKLGAVERIRFRTDDSWGGDCRWDLFDACVELSRQSWQGRSTTGTTMCHESIASFLRDMHVAACRTGCIDLNLMTVDGRPAAFIYNYVYRGRVSGLRRGYHPSFRSAGAGAALMHWLIQDSCERGDHLIDLLPGSLEAKRRIVTRVESTYRYCHIPFGVGRSQLLRVKRWLDSRRGAANAHSVAPRG